MNPKLRDLLKQKDQILEKIRKLTRQGCKLTIEIQKLEKAQRKQDLLGKREMNEEENE